ncbi:MAG: hypothetical protein HOI47_30285 [Candidatus Scalindua sp.]|jgi:hypothetical protein|nr:hypothetical protein [Candidatus Scalindua sp.]
MVVDGVVASLVNASDKGVGFKVMCKDLGDTFRVFLPMEKVKGEQLLNIGDLVKVDFKKFFPSGNEVRMEVKSVTLDLGRK